MNLKMGLSYNKLVDYLRDRLILVWGARMTGMGFMRFAEKNQLSVIGFIDSDLSLQGTLVNGHQVYSPDEIPSMKSEHKSIAIVVAVALKEDEIVNLLTDYGLSDDEYINYRNYVDNFYTIDIVGNCNLTSGVCY